MKRSMLHFNKTSCWLRRDLISRCANRHRLKTTEKQNQLAEDEKINLKEFHKLFNRYEIKHNFVIQKINYHEKKRHIKR